MLVMSHLISQILLSSIVMFLVAKGDPHRNELLNTIQSLVKQLPNVTSILKRLRLKFRNGQFGGEELIQNTPRCLLPWLSFNGLCLLYNYEYKHLLWKEAHEVCVTNGGHLVWFMNKEEHETVTAFLNYIDMPIKNWYYIGLMKYEKNTPLLWSSGYHSKYRP